MVAASGWSCADDTIGAGGQGGTSSGGAPSGGNGGAGAGGSMGQFAEGGHGGGCTLGDPVRRGRRDRDLHRRRGVLRGREGVRRELLRRGRRLLVRRLRDPRRHVRRLHRLPRRSILRVRASGSPGIQCNDGTSNGQSGIRVYGAADGSWVRTRRIWNEHAYHITNVAEDGTVPQHELPNWQQNGLDNFRQNKQPGAEFGAPDAVVKVAPACDGDAALVATVRNLGEAVLPAGVSVTFYEGTPGSGTLLGTAATQTALFPAEAENVVLAIDPLPSGTLVYAVVDENGVHPEWAECRTDNNTSAAVSATCGVAG